MERLKICQNILTRGINITDVTWTEVTWSDSSGHWTDIRTIEVSNISRDGAV